MSGTTQTDIGRSLDSIPSLQMSALPQIPHDLESGLQHRPPDAPAPAAAAAAAVRHRCEGCNAQLNMDTTTTTTTNHAFPRRADSDSVMHLGSGRRHEAGLHRRLPSPDKSNLDADQYQEFHRRYDLDEGDMTHYPEAYINRMDGMELDRMKFYLQRSPSKDGSSPQDERDSMFPLDKRWPFLLRLPANIFGVPMGIGSQSIVWKALATHAPIQVIHVPATIGAVIWVAGIVVLVVTSILYSLKAFYWPKAVYREFVHPVRSNFFIGPFLAALLLLLGTPPLVNDAGDKTLNVVGAFIFSVPVLLIEIHFYGHWLMGGCNRQLSAIANPTTQISVIGNFIGATAFAMAGWKDLGMFFFSAGLLHQTVVFLTIYMRLPSNTVLHTQLHPVLFLFVAPPCTAATAWIEINGGTDHFSKFLTFVGMFLYLLLISRAALLFRGVRFSLAWWAYTFPMGAVAMAAMAYSRASHYVFAEVLAVGLAFLSTATVMFVFLFSAAHSITGDLFPNDEVVGISLTPDQTVQNGDSYFSHHPIP